jgi:hypothetical protein
MPHGSLETPAPPQALVTPASARTVPIKAWLLKASIFCAITVVVLNPNLKRAFLQVEHLVAPEALIQTNFVALPYITAQLDRFVASDHGRHSEARLVARFVLKKIRYVSDYENWGNLDYWPTPAETWAKGQEDCDGRAILAASLLRARGFHSAALVVGLDHMWITVDENEKDPSKPPHLVALLSPNPDFSLELHKRSRMGDLLSLAEAFLHPKAFRDTSTHLFADIPALRKVLLIMALLALCYYPGKPRAGFLLVMAIGLLAANFLVRWEPDQSSPWIGLTGVALLGIALAATLLFRKPRQGTA